MGYNAREPIRLRMSRFSALFASDGAISRGNWLTQERIRRIAVCLAVAFAVLAAADFWYQTRQGQPAGRDFINYWSGAQLAVQDRVGQVYDFKAFMDFERTVAPDTSWRWYSYPPVTLLLSLPLGFVGFGPGLALWLAASFALCAALLAQSIGWRWALLATFAAPAILWNTLSGQNGAFSAALMAGGLMLLARRPWLAGALFGALCFKPHLMVLVPLALLAGGQYRALAGSIISATLLCLVSYALFGAQPWTGFVQNSPLNVEILEHAAEVWPRMPTIFAAVRYMGGGVPVAYGMHILGALAALVILIQVWRSPAPLPVKGAALILATFLVTPYAWDYDLVAVVFAVAWLVREGVTSGFRPFEKNALALALAQPLLVMPFMTLLHIQPGFALLWPALIVTWRRACQAQPVAQSAPILPEPTSARG